MKTICKITAVAALISLNTCDYLDVVPDDIATIDYAFRNRTEAEKYLYTCYSYRPQIGDTHNDPAMSGGDEVWQWYPIATGIHPIFVGLYIARGFQTSNNPYLNFWGGGNGGKALWVGIRDCNIFLENIDKVLDLPSYEKMRWIAEVKFLKAYYHYYLFKCYGPIPIVDVSLPISASADEVRVYREPVDKVVDYISALMLEAAKDLPNASEVVEGTEAGRVDKLAALSIRAELLLFAASPLFNGNTDYAHVVDNRGELLFNQTYDANKWEIAANACKETIDLCHAQNKELYDIVDPMASLAPEPLQLQTVYREAICARWNKELIWGSTNYSNNSISRDSHARIVRMTYLTVNNLSGQWAPTMKLVESYYSSHGVPINEDVYWQENQWYENRYAMRDEPSANNEIYYVKEGEKTVNLHFNREPRFYASIGFDRGIYYGSSYYDFPANVKHCEFINGEMSGFQGGTSYSITGYAAKKMHSFKCTVDANNTSIEYYPFPIMRLANLYLMYAEALNEFSGPSDEVYTYLDLIRERAGLEGVKESWSKYSSIPSKPNTQSGLREIIRQERTIELALEGKRFWDLRRWKQISEYNNQPQGWNVQGETPEDFYRVINIARTPVEFTVKDYFWPISESDIIVNKNLLQSYGW
jgi:hypothetical protein